jgi:hypothetical protein
LLINPSARPAAFVIFPQAAMVKGCSGSIPGIDRIGQQAAKSGSSAHWNACQEAAISAMR